MADLDERALTEAAKALEDFDHVIDERRMAAIVVATYLAALPELEDEQLESGESRRASTSIGVGFADEAATDEVSSPSDAPPAQGQRPSTSEAGDVREGIDKMREQAEDVARLNDEIRGSTLPLDEWLRSGNAIHAVARKVGERARYRWNMGPLVLREVIEAVRDALLEALAEQRKEGQHG